MNYLDPSEDTTTTNSAADNALSAWLTGDTDAIDALGDTADDTDAVANEMAENSAATITTTRRPLSVDVANQLADRRLARRMAAEDMADAMADSL